MEMASDDHTWKNSKNFFLGIVNPLMATWPFVINVKGVEEEVGWLESMTKGEIDEYGVVFDDNINDKGEV